MLSKIIGVLMVLIGAVWFLQGINVLKGSPMTGESRWVVIGALLAVGGLVVLTRKGRQKVR